ncbi:MAG: ASKHA domain-containing protein [Oscillospiraceae bacterium]|jgi:uncharacterized 2Fe-2S/4Fe-4S cluster protein (DUF4445 family)|nr:ASKHA domain-containing protein [Oscillospiraceae bacterium]
MREGCIGDCLACGKCESFSILDSFISSEISVEPRSGFGVAADIGTTSVVLALFDLASGKRLARHSFMNPQRRFGPDVISRIDAANRGHLKDLRRLITESVAAGIETLLTSAGVRPAQIADVTAAGNTTMTYLLLGLPCESLGVLPFKPAFELAEAYDFSGVFGLGDIRCPLHVVPWLSAFVGGDIVAGLLHMPEAKQSRFLLVDLGTNGEMALYDKGKLTVTSTAAGPAFEGSAHGGGASAVLDDLAALVRAEYVDETGLLTSGAPELFSQKEIRDLQLAKSAVRAGLEILLDSAGLDCDAIDAVYLAGGIGQAMDVNSAVTVGLLPAGLGGKSRAVGNASLGGAARLLLAPVRTAADMEKLLAAAREINLAKHPRFNELFMEHMYF